MSTSSMSVEPSTTDSALTPTGPTFYFPDGDLSFQSSDGVAYKVHRAHIDHLCRGLPPPECEMASDGVHILSEPSRILNILFSYLYPFTSGRSSLMPRDLPYEDIVAVAEALERYNVWTAMASWSRELSDCASLHPLESLSYAARTSNMAILDQVAPLVIQSNVPTLDVLSALPPAWLANWFHYKTTWDSVLRKAIKNVPGTWWQEFNCKHCPSNSGSSMSFSARADTSLDHCNFSPDNSNASFLREIASSSKAISLKDINDLLSKSVKLRSRCSQCDWPIRKNWISTIESSINGVAPFTHYIKNNSPSLIRCSTRISTLFNFPDADITIQSSDAVIFCIHKINLEICCGAFPPSSQPTMGEVVQLAETGSTLELLFQFIYARQHHQNWKELKFDKLYALAEAAEKYEVYTAMALCKIMLEQFLKSYPHQLLAYATKHGYDKLADQAAIRLLQSQLDASNFIYKLTPDAVITWARYWENFQTLLRGAISSLPTLTAQQLNPSRTSTSRTYTSSCNECKKPHCEKVHPDPILQIIRALGSAPEQSLFNLDTTLQQCNSTNSYLNFGLFSKVEILEPLRAWRSSVEQEIQKMPSFSSFRSAK